MRWDLLSPQGRERFVTENVETGEDTNRRDTRTNRRNTTNRRNSRSTDVLTSRTIAAGHALLSTWTRTPLNNAKHI